MRKERKIYTFFQLVSAGFMIMALLWLTVSAPFVYASQQSLIKHEQKADCGSPISNEEETNPFGNSTEEKTPGSTANSISEEYLHDHHTSDFFFFIASQYHKCEDAGTYIAFHGELLVPPPNKA
jgi:hypothetical protein